LTHCAFPALHEHRIRSGPGKVFGNGIRDWGIKWQLLLRGEKTINEALRQTLKLEVVKLLVGLLSGFRKPVTALWRSRAPPKRKKRLPAAYEYMLVL
jgi:hypothetical protein